MRMTVRLMHESRGPLKSTTDMYGFISSCIEQGSSWRVLHVIDVYGDTEVGAPELADLLADWDDAQALVRSFEDENCWHKVRALAVECDAGAELYLQFLGD